jgi:molybdopterin/thiamine biosynthesis adenylyltransferase
MGVFAPLTGIVGTMQAAEALKVLGDFGRPAIGRLLLIDSRSLQIDSVTLARDPNCPVCAAR